MSCELINTIRKHTEILFYNFNTTLQTCDLDFILCDMPIWKHVYHTLHSCDQWFINPQHFYAHLGNINAMTIIQTNKWPRVVGMSSDLSQGLYE